MPRDTAMKTIKLPFRFGRFLGRKLDPRRRESLEDSLRISNSRLEERQRKLDERAARRNQAARSTKQELAHEAQQAKGRRRIRDWASGLADLLELGDVLFRVLSIVVRGLLRVVGGVLDGLSLFDV